MSRVTFKTGKPHQEAAAVWARQRLADRGGRRFNVDGDQDGLLLADGVGMGKTWEAIAAAALILYKWDAPERDRRHVLILCPANLVSKWEDELSTGSRLQKCIDKWLKQLEGANHSASARRIHQTLTRVMPIRRSLDVQTRKRRGKFKPPGGTYIISHNLIAGGGRGLAALRREKWDVVIVDEAHGAYARAALRKLESQRRLKTKILLTATPFQLDPRQWNGLAANIVKSGAKVMRVPSVAKYLEMLSDVFEKGSVADPPPRLVADASSVLRRIAARTVSPTSNRTFALMGLDGRCHDLQKRLDALDDVGVRQLLADFKASNQGVRRETFERAYFQHRVDLALNRNQTFVAMRLRRVLSQGVGGEESPRLVALRAWAREAFKADIRNVIRTGEPEKTIVFTSFVGQAGGRDAEAIRLVLEMAYESALAVVRREHGGSWRTLVNRGAECLRALASNAPVEVTEGLMALAQDELTAAVVAARGGIADNIADELARRFEAISPLQEELRELGGGSSFEARTLRRRIRSLRRSVAPWASGSRLRPVERYTGAENRKARDRASTAFREIGPPWILVASNVGAEGIDLHTYTRRIVHYDLEWNPARMEQREGRGDRVGRKLPGKLEVLYCLVPDTYDERMFHQLVARDRWHGVLLGKPAMRLRDKDLDAALLDQRRLARMRLNLAL